MADNSSVAAKKQMLVKYWNGTIAGTVEAMHKDGVDISINSANNYWRDPHVRMAIRIKTDNEAGVMTKLELQQFWSRIVAGVEGDMVQMDVLEAVEEECPISGEKSTRHVVKKKWVSVPPKMSDKLKASEYLGKSVLAFVDKIELSADIHITIADILDADLGGMKRVYDADEPVVPENVLDMAGQTEYERELNKRKSGGLPAVSSAANEVDELMG
jgi:hypothetical protein